MQHNHEEAGCLQLLEISWNLKLLLEMLEISRNVIAVLGNLIVG